ncbi:hypothetical protein B0T21DRAFT_344707 [Apiosordaria backusii]|uniref:Uncharacterized protein n=1 Tax=Apiosordaria backusii TaxID=314023 RepID=A0AA40ESB5_9PEZI|nr:hypothetical protein B0T21DRAFT_344707 [Apiosordaria backusii]
MMNGREMHMYGYFEDHFTPAEDGWIMQASADGSQPGQVGSTHFFSPLFQLPFCAQKMYLPPKNATANGTFVESGRTVVCLRLLGVTAGSLPACITRYFFEDGQSCWESWRVSEMFSKPSATSTSSTISVVSEPEVLKDRSVEKQPFGVDQVARGTGMVFSGEKFAVMLFDSRFTHDRQSLKNQRNLAGPLWATTAALYQRFPACLQMRRRAVMSNRW